MKRYGIAALIGLCLLLLGSVTIGERFVIEIADWSGLSSDEMLNPDLNQATDMMNFEIQSENGKKCLVQRLGFHQITPAITTGDMIYGAAIYQPPGFAETIIAVIRTEAGTTPAKIIACKGRNTSWYTVKGAGADSTMRLANNTHPNSSVFLNKMYIPNGVDTMYGLTAVTQTVTRDAGVTGGGPSLLHQDRMYFWDRSSSQISWLRAFSVAFAQQDTMFDAGFVYVGREDGDVLIDVVPLGHNLVAYKGHSIYNVLISASSNAPEEVSKVTDNLGVFSYGCVATTANMHYFVGQNGIYAYDGTSPVKISQALDYWFADSLITANSWLSNAIKIQVVENRLYAALPLHVASGGGQIASGGFRLFVYDLQQKIWWKMRPGAYPITSAFVQLLRYDYSPSVQREFDSGNGGPYLTPRLFLQTDSAGYPVFLMFPDTKRYSDDGTKITATYTSGLSPIKGMWERKQLERAALFGSALGTDTVRVDWYGEGNTILDSTKFRVGSSARLSLRRLPPTISGALLKYRIRVVDSLRTKINAMELIGTERGLTPDE